jgi:hypothetical protein
MFLDVPWYELFWFRHFKEELAQSMAFAGMVGVANLLSLFSGGGVPPDRIVKDTYGVDFHERWTVAAIQPDDGGGDDAGEKGSSDIGESDKTTLTRPLTAMFEKKVIDLYQSAKDRLGSGTTTSSRVLDGDDGGNGGSGREVEVRLQIIPYETEFLSLYSLPYLSRDNSARDPHLVRLYKKMLDKKRRDRASDLNTLRREFLDQGRMESTVIAQCLVWCREVFYVRDVGTGQILQGEYRDPAGAVGDEAPASGKNVPHLVRMERTVITDRDLATGAFRNIQGDWIITDIDDLLGGNFVV